MNTFPEKESTFLLPGPAGQLEVLTTRPQEPLKGVGIICHPDPRQGGTMKNKVVTIVARAFSELGLATVRFNYRGIGASTGEYGHVTGELADLEAIISWVNIVLPGTPLWLAGFSFGSYVSALAAQTVFPSHLISIAPPVDRYPFQELKSITCPWLVIQGDQDEVVSFEEVKAWAANPPSPLRFVIMPGASHFFHGRLMELKEHIVNW